MSTSTKPAIEWTDEDRRAVDVIRALAMDTQFLCSPALAPYNVKPSTHHRQLYCSILFADGHTEARPNTNGRFTLTLGDSMDPSIIFGTMLSIFERADP